MSRVSRQVLTRSPADGSYELAVDGRVANTFMPGDEATWQGWLGTAEDFTFHGARGDLNVYLEARRRGGRYWYAYHTGGGRTRKRYLGAPARVTVARLEEVAAALAAASMATTPAVAMPVPDMAAVLPATKLAPPQPPTALVARERLLAALDAARGTPLTLVAAPAGWGKTTLLAAWARRHPRRLAWLALDGADDSPARFWTATIAALRAVAPGVGATALALLRAPQPPPPAVVVTALINELAGPGAGDTPLILLLDDYQVIADGAVRESVAFLLDHLPAGLRLVIAGRADPDLPLARLRARGQLAELRAADLGFTAEETGAFLGGALDAPLARAAVAALAARTEGWAAGVQLAALALRGRDDPATWLAGFTGGHRFLLDYVEEEVLARQSPAIRDFLLRAAVLTRLGADVCAAVTGEPDSGAILAGLERANLFIAPLDEGRRWYRLHDLFREALLARAAREPGLVPEAHRRAARWHAEWGDGRTAIEHALAAEHYPLAADLIAREAPRLWLGGEAGAVLGWLLGLPDDLLLGRARLALDAALRLLGAAGGSAHAAARQAIERLLDRLEGMRARPPAGEAARLRRRTRLLRALLAARPLLLRGDAAGVAPLAAEIEGLAAGDEARWQLPGLGYRIWLVRDVRYESVPLLPRLLALKRRALREGDRLATLEAMDCLAHEYTHLGRAALIERECLAALDLARRLGAQTIIVGALRFYLGYVYFGRDRLDESDSALRASLDVARIWQHTPLLVWGHQALARNALARADLAAADRALREAEALVGRPELASFAPPVAAMRARYWLATGEHDRAADWAARAELPPPAATSLGEEIPLTRARVALARGEYAGALAALDGARSQLDDPGDIPTTIAYLTLRLAALHGAGAHAAARAVAARLLALTEPEGWLRPYLDAGAPMAAALAALLAASDGAAADEPRRAYIADLLAAFHEERRAAHARDTAIPPGPGPLSLPGSATTPPMLVEPLTRREREVLAHLADGASNREIADALSLSVNTVKRHVGGLLGKLGVTGRTGAVARARAVGLL